MSSALHKLGMWRPAPAVLLMLGTAWLGGCASVSDKMSQAMSSMPVVGLPANAPERPAETAAFPAVHDMPPRRTTAVLTADEQRVMERELVSARNSQKGAPPPAAPAAAQPAKPAAKPAVAARAKPAPQPEPAVPPQRSSSQMIY